MKNPAKDKMMKNLTSKDCKRIVAVNMELLSEMEAVQETLANLMNPGVDMMDETIAAEDACRYVPHALPVV